MNDLYIALSYESLSGQLVGILLGLGVVAWALIFAPRYFRSVLSQRIFFIAVALRFVLIILSVTKIFNPPLDDFAWFEINAARIAAGIEPWVVSIASADNFNAFQAAIFSVFGASFYLADAIGLAGFALSVIFLGRFIRLLKLSEFEPWILLPFCFLPGSLLYLNYNTREVFQVLFLILMTHHMLRYRQAGGIVSLAWATLFGYLFAVTHNRYIVVVPILIGLGIFLPNFTGTRNAIWRRVIIFPFAIGLLLVANYISTSQGFLADVSDTGLVNYVSNYSYRAVDLAARTLFPFQLTSANPIEFVLKLPIMMVQFIFAPIVPFLISKPIDLLPAADTIIRALFLFGTIRAARDARASRAQRDAAFYFLACYFMFCGITLLGTVNVGTQERHQIKIAWLLFVAGAPFVAALFRGKIKWGHKSRRVGIRPVRKLSRSTDRRETHF